MNSVLSLVIACSFAVLPGEATYLEGHEAARLGRHGDAVRIFSEVAATDPALAPYAKLRAANSRAMAGDVDGGIRETQAVLSQHTTGPWVQWSHFQLARLLSRTEKINEAHKHYALATASPVNLWWLEDARREGAENALKVPTHVADGMTYFRGVVNDTRWIAKRRDAARILAKSDHPEDRIHAALGLLRSSKFAEAGNVAASIPQTWLTEPHLELQWKRLSARLLIVQGKRTEGMRQLEELALEYPAEDWADKALLYTGISLIRAEQWNEADRVMAKLHRSYMKSDTSVEGLLRIARAHAKCDHTDRAIEWYQRLVKYFPDHGDAATALLEAGHAYRNADREQEALGMYDQLLNDYPHATAASQAGYWAGLLLHENGQKKLAQKRFEGAVNAGLTEYYGFRAQEILVVEYAKSDRLAPPLNITPTASLVRSIPLGVDDPGQALDSMQNDRRFDRLRFFAHNALEEAEWEALYLFDATDNHATPELFYRAIGESGTAYSAMQWADARDFGVEKDGRQSVERMRVRYPRPYWDYVSALAEELNLDPYMILAIARQESTYRPNLTSSAGAKGVLQLMPRTAKWLGDTDPLVSKTNASRLEEPRHSLRMGAVYFRRMLDRSDGNVAFALASYNAGPGNFDKWKKRHPGISVPEFIELIPFNETRSYVTRILAHYATYKSIYE